MYEWKTRKNYQFTNPQYLAFVTKEKRDVFNMRMLVRIKELFLETAEQLGAELIEFNGKKDHIHFLLNLPANLPLADVVVKLKGKSAYFLRKEFWSQLKKKLRGKHLWAPDYCLVKPGEEPQEVIRNYLQCLKRPPSMQLINYEVIDQSA